MHAVRPVPNARMWITRGKALTIHPRVESRLREAGFQSIELTSPDENEVIARIREVWQLDIVFARKTNGLRFDASGRLV